MKFSAHIDVKGALVAASVTSEEGGFTARLSQREGANGQPEDFIALLGADGLSVSAIEMNLNQVALAKAIMTVLSNYAYSCQRHAKRLLSLSAAEQEAELVKHFKHYMEMEGLNLPSISFRTDKQPAPNTK